MALFNLIILTSLVCTCVYWCACIEVCPSHATNAEPISPLVTSVEAPYYALRPPLPASKTVLSSWSLVVICPLNDTGATGIAGSYHLYHTAVCVLYMYEYIAYVEVQVHL